MPERVGHAPRSTRLSAVYSEFVKRTSHCGRNFLPKESAAARGAPFKPSFSLSGVDKKIAYREA